MKINVKCTLAAILCGIMCLSLCGCNNEGDKKESVQLSASRTAASTKATATAQAQRTMKAQTAVLPMTL